MQALQAFWDSELAWTRSRPYSRHYRLMAGEEVLATLDREGWFGGRATGEAADGRWAFRRTGFLPRRTVVRETKGGTEVATFRDRWIGGGTLELAGGRTFRLVRVGFWRPVWVFRDADDHDLIHFRRTFGRRNARVSVDSDARKLPELSLLVAAGWYQLVLSSERAARAAS
jgi:hypothetical protein